MRVRRSYGPRERITISLVGLSCVSVGLFFVGALDNRSLMFDYMLWNLFLAWIPLLTVVLLVCSLRTHRWSDWSPLGLTLLWLLFLPNSFYMISDFMHIQQATSHVLYNVVMFTACILTGVMLGFSSLFIVHTELNKRLAARYVRRCIGVILLVCSFAIYLGRDLRWNSWDVLTNPAGILFDVSDHLIHPLQGGSMYTTTITFFVLLGSFYVAGWQIASAARQNASR